MKEETKNKEWWRYLSSSSYDDAQTDFFHFELDSDILNCVSLSLSKRKNFTMPPGFTFAFFS